MIFKNFQAKRLDLTGAKYVADGNSLTFGQGSTGGQSFPAQLATLLGTAVTNRGVNGQTTPQMISDASSQIDASFQAGLNVLVVAEVRNHISTGNGSVSVRQAVNSLWSYCDGRRAAATAAGKPLRIVVWNIMPALLTTSTLGLVTLNEMFVQANALMAAEWRAHANRYVDTRQDQRLLDPNDTTYFTDKLHLTNLGYSIVAQMVYAAIRSLR